MADKIPEDALTSLGVADQYSNATVIRAGSSLSEMPPFQDPKFPEVWYCSGYRVQIHMTEEGRVDWTTCNCTSGKYAVKGQNRCWHVAAALIKMYQDQAKLWEHEDQAMELANGTPTDDDLRKEFG